ncbi:hypothetical protein BU23DRAFT_556139 [Bimuria novae-zelandiae CBS 107.79]|uniref:Uncharacterized protein n=1 Tax=Bimuria novae-zelandiae CBS 107.79 TaxID=1447943 RepID=A0A6A5V378_9PLEO|nr:hypothetical protein BU23DRAFT_556139 [Bimuria novae-zelandiae CBS 107.79]
MLLFEVLPTTTPASQQLARELASLLPQLAVIQVTTKHKDMKLFEYKQTEKYKEVPRSLFNELAQANNLKHTIETRARVTFPTGPPNAERPTPTLQHLDAGWIEVPPGYIALVTLLIPEDCVKTVEIQVRPNLKEGYSATQQHNVLLFEGVYFRTEPAGVHYALLPVPTSPLGE